MEKPDWTTEWQLTDDVTHSWPNYGRYVIDTSTECDVACQTHFRHTWSPAEVDDTFSYHPLGVRLSYHPQKGATEVGTPS